MLVALIVALRRGTQRDRLPLLGSYPEVIPTVLPVVALAAFLALSGGAEIKNGSPVVMAGSTIDVFAAIFIASPTLRGIALCGLVLGILALTPRGRGPFRGRSALLSPP
jgi:hypothetical protein